MTFKKEVRKMKLLSIIAIVLILSLPPFGIWIFWNQNIAPILGRQLTFLGSFLLFWGFEFGGGIMLVKLLKNLGKNRKNLYSLQNQ